MTKPAARNSTWTVFSVSTILKRLDEIVFSFREDAGEDREIPGVESARDEPRANNFV